MSMLSRVLKRTGAPRKPKGTPARAADLTKPNVRAETTGTGFGSSPTPARGKPVDRGGGYRPWPGGKKNEPSWKDES